MATRRRDAVDSSRGDVRRVPTVIGMRTAATATALGITLSIAALASCANPRPGEMPVPTPSVTPVFASEEEALAAAGDAYQRYLDVSNAIAQAGWVDTSGFESVETGAALQDELEVVADYVAAGYRQVGSTTFDRLTLQQISDGGAGELELVVYLCLDVSSVDLVHAQGDSVVGADRPARQPLEVEFRQFDHVLMISRSDAWTGNDFC
jgi:hypothetical protein